MSNNYIGDIAENADVFFVFDTADASGASITATVAVADIEVYRQTAAPINLTQRSSTSGFTLDADHDGATGTHMVCIDTSDDTDTGFFAASYDYFVKLNTVTVDGVSISKWIGHFSVENRYTGADHTASIAAILEDTGTTLDGKIDTIDGIVDNILDDTAQIGTAGAGLTEAGGTGDHLDDLGGMSTAMKAEVNNEVGSAVETYGLDHLVSESVAGSDVADDSIIAQLVSSLPTADWSTFNNVTDSLEANRDLIGTAGAGLTEAGGTGDHLDDLGGMSTGMKAEVNTEVDAGIVTYGLDHLVSASVEGSDVAEDSIIAQLVSSDPAAGWSGYNNITDSLEAIRDEIGTAGAGLTEAGGTGDHLGDLGGMSTGMKAEVNAEALDVLNTDTLTLPGQVAAPLTPTLREAVAWLYKTLRNRKRQTADTWELYDDAGVVVDAKATVSDASGAGVKEQIGAGP